MINIKDIARILATRHSISNADADTFVQMIVEVINEGLFQDRQVKIKGFGTFKLQMVKERTSVNVNTGEKVVIGEHDKVSFTPDNVMKDLINKPFAHFDTVPVDDDSPLLEGKDISELDLELDDEYADNTAERNEALSEMFVDSVVDDRVELTEEPEDEILKQQVTLEEIPLEQKETSVAIEKSAVEANIESPMSSDNENTAESTEDVYEECELPNPRCRNIFIYYGVIINIFVAVCAFIGGYVACDQRWFVSVDEKQSVTAIETKAKPQRRQSVTAASYTENNDTVNGKKTGNTEVDDSGQKKNDVPETVHTTDYDKDVRVRTGAYYIVGTELEVTVKEGQTLASISRAYLGDGMECYVEVYNNIKNVSKGDKIKIPKLQLKKAVKKKL